MQINNRQKTITLLIASLFTVLFLPFCSDDTVIKELEEEEVEEETIVPEFNDSLPYVFKANLSEYNFFIGDLKNLQPASDVEAYELSTPLFSDHTIKHRFIRLRSETSINYTTEGVLDFPFGTIIIKNFSSLDALGNEERIETRLLVLDPFDGRWKAMGYLWNDDQTEAVKQIVGATKNIMVKDEDGQLIETVYKVPNVNECKICHTNNSSLAPIGPKVRSLNFIPIGWQDNQLEDWSSRGILKNLPSADIPVLPNWLDEVNYSLNERARAYLDINCAHCHAEGGDAFYTGLFLDYEQTDTTHLGYFKSPIAAGPGSGNLTYDIVPGRADSSIIYFRMKSADVGIAMPELARSIVHEEGVELIREWINSL